MQIVDLVVSVDGHKEVFPINIVIEQKVENFNAPIFEETVTGVEVYEKETLSVTLPKYSDTDPD